MRAAAPPKERHESSSAECDAAVAVAVVVVVVSSCVRCLYSRRLGPCLTRSQGMRSSFLKRFRGPRTPPRRLRLLVRGEPLLADGGSVAFARSWVADI